MNISRIRKSPLHNFSIKEQISNIFNVLQIKKTQKKIKNEWKEELNRLGNLVLLESNLNRSINNKHNKKEECYRQSVYKTVQALAHCVSSWNKEAAENRRRELTDKMAAYIFSTGTGH